MINEFIISKIAFKSLICEVSATPKPGLVDLIDSGSHKDMNYLTFIKSSVAISDYFKKAYLLGIKNYKFEDFIELREEGKFAEIEMYKATEDVNTHKGIIFSLGLLVYATGIQKSLGDVSSFSIVNRVKSLCSNITEELNNNLNTAGGLQYKKYGLKGIRNEAEEGFEKALTVGLYNFKRYIQTLSFNDAIVNTLMHFMEILDDSNLIKRGGLCGLNFAKESASKAIELGSMNTNKGRAYIANLNKAFIAKNLSPGGSADYIILTLYFYFLEEL